MIWLLADIVHSEYVLLKTFQNTNVNSTLMAFLALMRRISSRFYARKQNASRVFAIVWASVSPSVRLSVCHTRELYQNGAS